MDLGELKKHFESFPDSQEFSMALSNPFSWRGSYDEVAFDIIEGYSTKYDNLSKIDLALSETFYGYKGGEFKFTLNTSVNFENKKRSYTDGQYARDMISKLTISKVYGSEEEKLINIAFNKL